MKTNWEAFGRRLQLWYHHGISAAMRLRYYRKPKNINGYGDALAFYMNGMLNTLSRRMEKYTLVSIRRLDPDDAEHGTWNLVFEGRGRPEYAPGDMAYLSWRNPPETVQQILTLYGEDGDRPVVTTGYSSIYTPGRFESMTLKEALARRVDLNQAGNHLLKRAGLGHFISHNKVQDKAHHQFHKDTAKEGGLVVTHPQFLYRFAHLPSLLAGMSSKPTLPQLLRSQERISARPYTMSGFRQVGEDCFHFEVTVSQVNKRMYVSAGEQQTIPARGATFFASLKPGDEVEGWLLPETHKFPATIGRPVPTIVICTGSGISSVLSLLKAGAETGPLWLIYGVRSWTTKHLYGPELQGFLDAEKVTRLSVANSRPVHGEGPAHRVQSFLWEHRAEVAEQIRQGAHFYLCGRFSMGTEVAQTLEKILVDQGLAADQPAARKTLVEWTVSLRLQASVSGV